MNGPVEQLVNDAELPKRRLTGGRASSRAFRAVGRHRSLGASVAAIVAPGENWVKIGVDLELRRRKRGSVWFGESTCGARSARRT